MPDPNRSPARLAATARDVNEPQRRRLAALAPRWAWAEDGRMNAAQRAREQLQTWPQLSWGSASCGAGEAVRFRGTEIMHFHSPREAALHLSAEAIDRLQAQFARSTAIRLHPTSEWITVHLDCPTDADLLLALVSVALHVHAPTEAEDATGVANRPCQVAIGQLGGSNMFGDSGRTPAG
jgi:hypothetical protein